MEIGASTLESCLAIVAKAKPLWNVTKKHVGSSHCGLAVTSPTSIHEYVGLIPSLTQWVKDPALPREQQYRSQMRLGFGVAVAVA